jgi:uncharacterized membrane protein
VNRRAAAPHPHRMDPRRAAHRVVLACALGAATFSGLAGWSRAVAALAAWDVASLVLLTLAWLTIAPADARATQRRAGSEDPGRTLVWIVVFIASGVSLFAATMLARGAKALPPEECRAVIALSLGAVALAWSLTHTAFTLRYAHLYYREDHEGVGGVELPGGHRPTYFDFAYFAFTIGMCFQVSDVTVTSRQIRRAVLLHAVLSFAYNTLVLAFVLNLVFGMAG